MKNLKETTPDISSFHPPSSPSSYFLSFEGIEGSGKSTQLKSLKAYLESLGLRVIVLREPGGTTFGEKLRESILASEEALHPAAGGGRGGYSRNGRGVGPVGCTYCEWPSRLPSLRRPALLHASLGASVVHA